MTKTAARDGMEIHMRMCGSILEAVEMISLQILKLFLFGTETGLRCSEIGGNVTGISSLPLGGTTSVTALIQKFQ